jgi:aryl-alcohol dehydrogenase-like predicted oxidoreductase
MQHKNSKINQEIVFVHLFGDDVRPEEKMIPFCQKHNIRLLTYGTVLGGFLSERFLIKHNMKGNNLMVYIILKFFVLAENSTKLLKVLGTQ